MVARAVAILVCLLALAPEVGAATIFTPDPAHDAVVSQNGVTIPVDSIDIIGFASFETGPNLRGASITVGDLSRRGLEDRLFVQSAHSYRAWSYVELYPDYSALNFVAVQIDGASEINYAVFLVRPGSYEELPVSLVFDESSDTIRWRLQHGIAGEPQHRFAWSSLFGCDDDETCQPALPKARAYDMAPNTLAQPLTELIPPVWWNEIMPEDDGSVPTAPVSLAGVASAI